MDLQYPRLICNKINFYLNNQRTFTQQLCLFNSHYNLISYKVFSPEGLLAINKTYGFVNTKCYQPINLRLLKQNWESLGRDDVKLLIYDVVDSRVLGTIPVTVSRLEREPDVIRAPMSYDGKCVEKNQEQFSEALFLFYLLIISIPVNFITIFLEVLVSYVYDGPMLSSCMNILRTFLVGVFLWNTGNLEECRKKFNQELVQR